MKQRLVFYFFRGELQATVLLASDDEYLSAKSMTGMVEDALRVESFATDTCLEMQVVGGGASCTPL